MNPNTAFLKGGVKFTKNILLVRSFHGIPLVMHTSPCYVVFIRAHMWQCKYECNLRQESFSKTENEKRKKKVIFRHFYISSSSAPEEIFRMSSGLIMSRGV